MGDNADLKAKLKASVCPINQVVAVTTEADGLSSYTSMIAR